MNRMNQSEIDEWCDENLPEIYHTAMFDFEEVADRVWEEFHALTAPFENMLEDTVLDHLSETAHAWMKAHHELIIETSLEPVAEQQLQQLVLQRQTPQHATEWYAEKSECLTASEIHDIFSGSRAALLRRKVALYRSKGSDASVDDNGISRSTVSVSQPDGNMMATYWGHRFEPIIRRIYEEEKAGRDTVLDGLGRFRHADPAFEWLRASPDGLVMRGPLAGRLVEIKAPKTRIPDDLVPSEYWIQMQMQAEVLNLDAVEFVEGQFQQRHKSAMTAEDWITFTSAKWKGELMVVNRAKSGWKVVDDLEYIYSDPVRDASDLKPLNEEKDEVLEESCWWLTGFFPRTVLRDREWWESVALPQAQAFWAEYLEAREKQEAVVVERIGWEGST